MPCPRDGAALTELVVGVTHLERCPSCRGVWGTRAQLEALVGAPIVSRPTSLSIDALGTEGALACPGCGKPLHAEETRAAPGQEVLVCHACSRLWLDEPILAALRETRSARSLAPDARSRAGAPAPVEEHALGTRGSGPHLPRAGTPSQPGTAVEHGPSVFSPGPVVELAVMLGLFVLAWGLGSTRFGEALAFLPRIQFHELGHAMVAWSTGRSALPLPFGLTSWSLERSWLLVAMELLFASLLLTHGVRVRSAPAIAVAVAMASVLTMGLATPLDASEEWLVAGGMVGEALLPALALLAFHLPLPARFRWDFWRWLLALFALVALASVVRGGWQIEAGEQPVPFGSFVGQSMDGDLDRLVNDHGWAASSLRPLFGRLATLALVLWLVPHTLLVCMRWLRARREREAPAPAEP